jgi:hypothetical protein
MPTKSNVKMHNTSNSNDIKLEQSQRSLQARNHDVDQHKDKIFADSETLEKKLG